MNRKISYAQMHQEAFVPGLGPISATLPPGNKTYHIFQLTEGAAGVEFNINGRTGVLPWVNFKVVVFAEDNKSSGAVAAA